MGLNANDINSLFEAYKPIYYSHTGDFNVLSTIHMSENDHTNVLCEILNMKVDGNLPFMKSFVQNVLGIDNLAYESLVAKTQIPAIGQKNGKSGFIDLLIEDKNNNTRIIIENKVCGAGDGKFQLQRYYFTFVKVDENGIAAYVTDSPGATQCELKKVCQTYWDSNNFKNLSQDIVYVVYLTDVKLEHNDNSNKKNKNESSFQYKKLKDVLKSHYKEISYEEHIYGWLKKEVLPHIPYGKNGDAHNSVILYLRE